MSETFMKKLLVGAVAAMALGGAAVAANAQPVAIYAHDPYLQDTQFAFQVWGGRHYCWYDGGWKGPGWYWCGYPWRTGYGWGGGWGWNGWRGGHPGGGYRGGGYRGGGGFRGAAGFHGGGGHGGGGHGGGGHGGGGHGGGGGHHH
jgi:hypothetical protein